MHKYTPKGELILAYAILLLGSIIMLLPLAWMTSAAFKPLSEIIQVPPTWIPRHFTLDNFKEALTQFPILRYLGNSLLTTSIIVVGVLITSTMAGYALTKLNWPLRDTLFIVFLSALMIPLQVRMIPLYRIAMNLHLIDTYTGVIFPWLFDALGIFLMRQFIASIPDELIDAARIDGASEGSILIRIVLPNIKPALSALAIFTFSWAWDEFLWPLLICSSDATRTLPVGLQYFSEQYGLNIHWQMAGALLAVAPVLVVFLFMQRQFIEGVTLTGMK
ncbi:multiple sugar transport system permease protein [Thermanaeromonas toyohensis ToBE]|uniref:Multiple sugar transport system permease protein n=1 Tax=Thermanaeromonas toyohensis ToBE TaxID=698762 RepID=A0A1W1VW83_9FIRM|nr:carbohydrate ABC transporter permease [Thermanaeromonas toyohensis]SMB97371.1 multiple sugar transport system permease protein [Thermanaeromonas toyohensis ToBE]